MEEKQMKLRPPAIPLITIDPFTSVWSKSDKLNESTVMHWTGSDYTFNGIVTVDGKNYCFMGIPEGIEKAKQVAFDYSATSTFYTFEAGGITLHVNFTSPLVIDDFYYLTRPVSYIYAYYESKEKHTVSVKLELSEEFCLNKKGEKPVGVEFDETEKVIFAKMGSLEQKVLNRSGDDHRIDWGYVYLAAKYKNALIKTDKVNDMQFVSIESTLDDDALFLVGYDDIASIEYFGKHLKSYWCHNGETITEALDKASEEYEELFDICESFSDMMYADACRAGGTKYAEMLLLAYRQALAAHKLVLDEDGSILYISKECFSNGCAATVDVSYPSIPMFLLYNPELVKGMMRPIYKYAASDVWTYDFAPHDVGQYPLLNGQKYGENWKDTPKSEMQMPVEECGNMLIMEAAAAVASEDVSFAKSHLDTLSTWVKYLINNGSDPANQLCTDDFAGHFAHNCNLSLKAIMGIAAYGIICDMTGDHATYEKMIETAKEMALSWAERAKNEDGSYRLAFDRPETFSLKYNAVWDKVFDLGIFPKGTFRGELASNFTHINPYGMPLDNRETYTKSDWLVWTATMTETDDEFEKFVEPLWTMYNYTLSRVPMTDWYYTITAEHRHFRHRSVIGGLFMKLLYESKIAKYDI